MSNVKKTYFSQQSLEALDLVFAGIELATGKFEECGPELEKQDMRQTVLMHKQYAFY